LQFIINHNQQFRKDDDQMLQPNLIRTGFLLGISLLLAAIVYFFAANWAGMDRMQKVVVSAGLVALFYGVAFILTKLRFMPGSHSFLARVFLVSGCITFGVGVALLGQIYNSHADSYGLFLIWSVPALLFAIITRYTPFYILSYVLVHLTLWFYFFPASMWIDYSENMYIVIYAIFAVINLLLFVVHEIGWLKSNILQIFSFIAFHAALLALSNSLQLTTYGVWFNLLSIAVIAAGFYYFIRTRMDKLYLTLNALATSAFAVLKFIELAEAYASVAFFIYGLVFVALLLTGNVLFFRFLKSLPSEDGDIEEKDGKDGKAERLGSITGTIVSSVVIVIGIIIGSISLTGLVMMASLDADPENVLYGLSLLFVLPMIIWPNINSVVRYTVLTIGYISGMVAIVWIGESYLSAIYLILSVAVWIRSEGHLQRLFTYTLININMMIMLDQMFDLYRFEEWAYTTLTLTIMNAIVYGVHFFLTQGAVRKQLRDSGLYFCLFFLLWLTFMDPIFANSYEIFNLLNFVLVTSLVFIFIRREQAIDVTLTLILWFVFLAYKYYDLLWTLLHKSITLAILGFIILAATYMLAHRYGDKKDTGEYHGFLRKQGYLMLIVIVLQFGFLGIQTVKSEHLLKTGSVVKLELQPIDPRSLLQGDYVVLNYHISTLSEEVGQELEDRSAQRQVSIVLAPDDRGVHVFKRLYNNGETLAPDEIMIRGTRTPYSWNHITYGIESYFIPEGTGLEVEQDAKFAYVRIGANGDALLERLSEE
jgi:uncharacterized membrane-anchored protein/uncharacterized membrane protein